MRNINKKSKKIGAEESSDKDIEEFKAYIKKAWNNSKPLAKLFKTSSGGYLYDSGTNKIMACDELVFQLIENIISMEINKAVSDFVSNHNKEEFLVASNAIINTIEMHS